MKDTFVSVVVYCFRQRKFAFRMYNEKYIRKDEEINKRKELCLIQVELKKYRDGRYVYQGRNEMLIFFKILPFS